MREIPLTQGKFAKVDDADYESLNQYKWCVTKDGNTHYAVRGIWMPNSKQTIPIRMHRVILKAPKNIEVDHRNGNGLDNRRSNLRLCTSGQNTMHQKLNGNNTTGFKGVTLDRRAIRKLYWARIQVNNKRISLGCYSTPEAAARVYDAAALKYHRDFALTNEMLGFMKGS